LQLTADGHLLDFYVGGGAVMFKGSIVAIVTPFMKGKVDEEGFRRLIEFQIENGTSAIVPVGTTGESATLDME